MSSDQLLRAATLSPCGTYRYSLTRQWGPVGPSVLFAMLNPSTATAEIDDPTIRRCIGFARAWGATRLEVVNVCALRSTNPGRLLTHDSPIGPGNDEAIQLALVAAHPLTVIAAWGAWAGRKGLRKRAADVLKMLSAKHDVWCLGRTQEGHPKHPLYVSGGIMPELFAGKVVG